MSTNGILDFQGTNKATFVGENSNVVIDTVNASFGIGVDVNGPTSNLHVVGNAYVSTELTVGGSLSAAKDQDVTSYFGRAAIGYNGTNSDAATFAHVDHNTPESCALRHSTGGATRLNAKGNQSILFTVGNVEKARFKNNGDFVVDTDTLYVDAVNDRVGIGTSTPGSTLDVVGDATISSNLAVSGSKFTYDNTNTTVFTGTASAEENEIGYLDMSTSSNSNNIHVKVYIKYGKGADLGDAEYSFYIRPNSANDSLIYDYRNKSRTITPVVYRTNANDLHSGGTAGVVRFGYSIASAQNVIWRVEVQQRFGNATFYPTNTGSAMVTTGLVQVTPAPYTRIDSNVAVGGDDLFVDTVSRRVGIGTTSPSLKLDVHSSARPSNYPFAIGGTGTNKANYVAVTVNPGNNKTSFTKDFVFGGAQRPNWIRVHAGGAAAIGAAASAALQYALYAEFTVAVNGTTVVSNRQSGDTGISVAASGSTNGIRVTINGGTNGSYARAWIEVYSENGVYW